MQPDVERARQELEHAREMSERLWAEYRAYAETLDPARGVAGPEELRRMMEASDWTRKIDPAEQAVFVAEHGGPGIVGAHGEYQWLTKVEPDISALLRLCPDVVLGKYLAVTGIDGTTLQLTDQEKSNGWWTADHARVFRGTSWAPPQYRDDWKVAYSPRLTSIHGLPNETHDECDYGYHEWYVFDQPIEAGEMEAFVNWVWFRLNQPDWCTDRFWEQMERLRPESYLSDGAVLTLVTRNRDLFASVLAAFTPCEAPSMDPL
jgi:hypothetical protein